MKLTLSEIQSIESEMLQAVANICKKYDIEYFIAYGTCIGAIRHGGAIPWDADIDIVIPYNQLDNFICCIRRSLPDKYFLDFHDINPNYTATFPRVGLKGYSSVILHLDVFLLCGSPSIEKERKILFDRFNKLRKRHFFKVSSEKYRGKMNLAQKIKELIYKMMYSPFNLVKIRKEFYSLCDKYSYSESEYVINPSGGYGYKEIIPKKYFGSGKAIEYNSYTVNVAENIEDYLHHFYGDYMCLPPEKERVFKESYSIHEMIV